MKLTSLAQALSLNQLIELPTDVEIGDGYASDLLSDVLANAPMGGILITVQVHMNVIAVATHAGLAAIVFSSGRVPDDDVLVKARDEGIALFRPPPTRFKWSAKCFGTECGGALHEMLFGRYAHSHQAFALRCGRHDPSRDRSPGFGRRFGRHCHL